MKQNKSKKSKEQNEKNLEDMEKQLEQLEAEKAELFDKLQRISADYANFQKRTPKRIADSVEYEKKAIIRSLLPSLDNFSLALAGAENAKGLEALDGIVKGIKLVFDHMLDGLKMHGVEHIEAVGKVFDPSLHEAIQTRAEEDKEDNIVLEEFQKGYMINKQVLRPSKVIVNKLPGQDDQQQEEGEPQEEDDIQNKDRE
jgi:molecular chaperone GrpE